MTRDETEPKPSWAKRLVRRLERTSPLVLLFFVAVFISSIITVSGGAKWVVTQVNDSFYWEDDENDRLAQLRAGTTMAFFVEKLGEPEFTRPVLGRLKPPRSFGADFTRGPYVESGFRGRGYWVQTISNRDETVVLFAVTACDRNFRPVLNGPYGDIEVTLNESTFGHVLPWKTVKDRALLSNYFASGATANSTFFDILYGGNPGDYKTIVWGVNDACQDWFHRYEAFYDRGLLPLTSTPKGWGFKGETWRGGKSVRAFRAGVIVNTYGETAPAAIIDFLNAPFQPGVDRIVIRTLAPLVEP